MNHQEAENGLRNILKIITRYYWVFLISGLLSLILAYFYNKYAPKKFDVVASILINEDSKSPLSGPQEFMVSDLFGNSRNVYNELLILQSKPILKKTIQNLDLEVTYYEKYNYAYHDIYKLSPFKITFYRDHPQLLNVMFNISFKSDGSYLLHVDKQDAFLYDFIKDKTITEVVLSELKLQGNLGQVVETDQYKFIISLNKDIDEIPSKDKKYAFKMQNHYSIENYYKRSIEFSVADRNATVINMKMETSILDKDIEVMNELIGVYAESNLERKNHIANLTIDYIEKQLEEVSQSLDMTESALEEFLSKNKLIDVESQANRYTDQLRELQNELAISMVQKRYYYYALEYLKEQSNDELIISPSAMGVQDDLLNQLIMDLSSAQRKKANLIENNQERNPMVHRLTIQIGNLKAVIAENIRSANQSNNILINELEKRIARIENEISSLPEAQRTLGGIERHYQLNDAIYNYISQNRAEAEITTASNLPDMTIVQPAAQNGIRPVAPKSYIIYPLALLLGLGIPFVLFYIIDFIGRAKIETREDLQNLTNSRVLGTVLHLPSKYRNKNVFMHMFKGKSNYAEAYRTMYTNLNFALKDKKSITILVTSSVTEEGKTFNALNIAAAYADMKRTTILVNCDLKKCTKILDTENSSVGLSTYLSGSTSIDHLIEPTDMAYLSYISAGPISPINTVELLSSTIMEELMTYLKKHYECIILDTSPLAQVSDAYYLIHYADINLIVSRYQFTRKKILLNVLNDLESKNIHNTGLILNDNPNIKEQFSYGYGYYGKTKSKGKSNMRKRKP